MGIICVTMCYSTVLYGLYVCVFLCTYCMNIHAQLQPIALITSHQLIISHKLVITSGIELISTKPTLYLNAIHTMKLWFTLVSDPVSVSRD